VQDGSVWARPEVDRFCAAGNRAYFVRVAPSTTYEEPQVPEAAGCKARFAGTELEVGTAAPPCGAGGIPGQTYCCPATLPEPRGPIAGGGATCEQVTMDYLIELGVDPFATPPENGGPGPTDGRSGAILNQGRYLDRCGVSQSARVQICAAVRQGRATGVTVCLDPPDRAVGECVAQAVRALDFPKHDQLDVTHTNFEPMK